MEVIFVHGALVRDGDWWWRPTAALLHEKADIRSRSVALPSCGEAQRHRMSGGLAEDAAALRAVLDDVDSAIVVGHSYGGTVIAEAGQHPAIEHLLYISSYLPEVGESQSTILGGENDPASISDNGSGTLSLANRNLYFPLPVWFEQRAERNSYVIYRDRRHRPARLPHRRGATREGRRCWENRRNRT